MLIPMNMLESISGYDFVIIDGYAYFSNVFYNALFKVEIRTGNTVFIGNFENEMLSENNIHLEIMREDEKVYFFPRRGRFIHVYHLLNDTMQSIEIRKKTEQFFVIEEVVWGDDFVYFLPKQKDAPIKKMDRYMNKVTEVNNRIEIQGKYLSKYRNIIPAVIIEKYQIEHGSQISCKQMSDGKWYCFMPIGRQMLCFVEKTSNLEIIPLIVVNEVELQNHIYKVKQELFKARTFFPEFRGFDFRDFSEVIMLSGKLKHNYCGNESKCDIGKMIWNIMD